MNKMLLKIKPIFTQKKYLLVFLGMSVVSFATFLILTLLFSWSRFLFFNYFLTDAIEITAATFMVAAIFSISFGFLTSLVAYNFKDIICNRLREFLAISVALYVISYILMLAK